MPTHHRPRRRGQADGIDSVDPSVFFGSTEARGPDRKTYQLCRQAARALTYALAESSDDILRDAMVDSVMPAPDASRLLVTVIPAVSDADPDRLLEHLRVRKDFLRARVAAAICRKRAPELAFCVASPEAP